MKKTITTLASCLAIGSAQATVVIDVQVGELRQSNGTSLLADNSVAILVADTNNDGFDFVNTLNGTTLSAGQTIGIDDVIISAFQVDYGNGGAIVVGQASFELGSSFAENDDLAFVWFDGITSLGTEVTALTKFGLIASEAVSPNSGGSIGTSVPGDGNHTLAYFDNGQTSGASGLNNAFFTADQVTAAAVPEPSSTVLLGLGTVGFLLRRRRQA